MLVFNQKFVSGSRKIKSTIEGLAFDRPCWAIMPDLLRTLHIDNIESSLFANTLLSAWSSCSTIAEKAEMQHHF